MTGDRIGPWVSTLHYYISPDDYPGAADLLSQWDSHFTTAFQNACTTGDTIDHYRAVEVPYGSGAIATPDEATLFKGINGTRTLGNTSLDGSLVNRATLHTGAAGRRNRGGLYSPPCYDTGALGDPHGFATGSQFWVRWTTFLADLLATKSFAGSNPHPWVWCVYSRTNAKQSIAPPYRDVTGYVVDATKQYWLRKREFREQ